MAKPTPIDKVAHKDLKVKPNTLELLKDQHLAPVVAHEFPSVASQFPIIFVKDQETGQFRVVAMLGLEPGENLFFKDGKWDATYLPANYRAYPFSLAAMDQEGKNIAVCIDVESDLVSKDEGQALFDEDGEQSAFLKGASDFVTTLVQQNEVTRHFVNYLVEKELLAPQSLTVSSADGKKHDLNGIYRIDEKKFNELSDEDFLELRKRGYLVPIYAHFSSTMQINSLGKRKQAS